jgi:hypothetical protein
MLRIETHESSNTLNLRLEGRFTGDDARHIRTLMTRCHPGMRLVVDLTDVTYVDSVGETVLSFFRGLGAAFVAQTSYSLDICERLHLHLASSEASDSNKPGTFPTIPS